jgi:phosphate-selective porin O/P
MESGTIRHPSMTVALAQRGTARPNCMKLRMTPRTLSLGNLRTLGIRSLFTAAAPCAWLALASPAAAQVPPPVVAPAPAQPQPVAPLPPPPAPEPVASPAALPPLPPPAAYPPPVAPDSAVAPPPQASSGAPEPAAASSKPQPEITAAPGKGITFKVGDAFSLNLRSRFQLRYQMDIPPKPEDGDRDFLQTVNIGTARFWFSGNVFRPEITYMLQLAVAGRDYRDGAISPIFDAYVDWKADRDFNIRAGQFFVPFDRLRTVREFALQMADRPVPIGELTLDRDAGVVLYSEKFLGSPIAWRAGLFGGGGTNLTTGKEPGFLAVARLEARPLGPIDDDSEGDLERRHKPGLAIGAGIARNWNTNRQRSTTGTTFTGGTTDYLHIAADAVFKWEGFALQLEYLYKNTADDRILSLDDAGATRTEWTRSGSGYVAQASYTFDPPFEIVGRYSKLNPFVGTDPRLIDTDEYGVGFNYYLNGHQFKIQTDWIVKVPEDGKFDDSTQVAHVQLDATF